MASYPGPQAGEFFTFFDLPLCLIISSISGLEFHKDTMLHFVRTTASVMAG